MKQLSLCPKYFVRNPLVSYQFLDDSTKQDPSGVLNWNWWSMRIQCLLCSFTYTKQKERKEKKEKKEKKKKRKTLFSRLVAKFVLSLCSIRSTLRSPHLFSLLDWWTTLTDMTLCYGPRLDHFRLNSFEAHS